MLHKFRVQYILIDFSDNGFLVSQFRFPSILKKDFGWIFCANKRILQRSAICGVVWWFYGVLLSWNLRTWENNGRRDHSGTRRKMIICGNTKERSELRSTFFFLKLFQLWSKKEGFVEVKPKVTKCISWTIPIHDDYYYYVYTSCN